MLIIFKLYKMLNLSDIQLFIKKNSKDLILTIDYTDECDIYTYTTNICGKEHNIKILYNDEYLIFHYDNKILTDDNDIQLELFEIFNYKNIEYIDCYIINKRKNTEFEINDLYDDDYDNTKDMLICKRSFIKNDELIKIRIIIEQNDYKMYYNNEIINGFENIILKIDNIL
jgi:hypothetical protein